MVQETDEIGVVIDIYGVILNKSVARSAKNMVNNTSELLALADANIIKHELYVIGQLSVVLPDTVQRHWLRLCYIPKAI